MAEQEWQWQKEQAEAGLENHPQPSYSAQAGTSTFLESLVSEKNMMNSEYNLYSGNT